MYVHLTDAALKGAAGHGPPRARQQPGHRGPGPRLVRNRRQRGRETGDRPRGPRPGRVTGGAGEARRTRGPARQDLCLPVVQPACTPLRQGPFGPPHHAADRPARATWRPCADATTGSRPTAPGPTARSSPAPTCGPRSTATSTSATPPAPSTSPATDPGHPTSCPAPHPAHGRGHSHARTGQPTGGPRIETGGLVLGVHLTAEDGLAELRLGLCVDGAVDVPGEPGCGAEGHVIGG